MPTRRSGAIDEPGAARGVTPTRGRPVHVTGAGGQVGVELAALLSHARLHNRQDLDVTDRAAVHAAVEGAGVVVHLAALTNVDECERDPERAFAVNAHGAEHVADAARATGARVVFVSSDYVFDGTTRGEYAEDDPPAPVNVYGRAKLEGERAVLRDPGNLVVRTSWVYGRGRNFVSTILGAARAGNEMKVVADQLGRPTWARDLARALLYLVDEEASGTIHVAGDGAPGSWADLADEALAAAGLPARVERVDTAAYARTTGRTLAPRPANSALALDRARSMGVPLEDWKDSVRAFVEEGS